MFDTSGKAYLGVDSTNFGQQGLVIFDGTSVTKLTNDAGKVLAISPDQTSVITSDTVDSPKQFFICTGCSAASRTVTALTIPSGGTGPTAAAFSPDSLKAYILAGNTLYVYSKVDPLQTIPLSGTANDVAFHPEGGFAFIAGQSGSITPYRVCDNAQIAGTLSTPNAPAMIRALPDGQSLLVLDPPNIDIINVTSLTSTLCTGAITDTINSFNLGEGSFTPTQFIVSPDGQKAYILGETQAGPPPSRLPFILVFNLTAQTPAVLSLTGSVVPLSAALSPTGNLLFVGANDGTVHVIDTASGLDTQQVTFPFPTNELCLGPGNPATQVPLSQVGISAAAQNGPSTTYSYSLTSGPALKPNQSITISKMRDGVNNGTFTISSLGTDASGNPTFTVTNAQGVNASGQSGVGVVPISCNPNLVAVKP
jgi:WD40 repeat protein